MVFSSNTITLRKVITCPKYLPFPQTPVLSHFAYAIPFTENGLYFIFSCLKFCSFFKTQINQEACSLKPERMSFLC